MIDTYFLKFSFSSIAMAESINFSHVIVFLFFLQNTIFVGPGLPVDICCLKYFLELQPLYKPFYSYFTFFNYQVY